MTSATDVDVIAKDWLNEIQKTARFSSIDGNHFGFQTPFTDPYGDEITLLITAKDNNRFLVSDQGYTVWNLESHGVRITKKGSTRFALLDGVVRNNHVNFDVATKDIFLEGTADVLPTVINNVLAAVLKVSDFAYMSHGNIRSMFHEDVAEYLKDNQDNFAFESGLSIIGDSGMNYPIDYLFRQTLRDSRLTNLHTTLDRNRTTMIMGTWFDTDKARKSQFSSVRTTYNIVIPEINSQNQQFVDHLATHHIHVIPFSDKNAFKQALAIQNN
ncbi:DUF1828 domain-containing protein [Schleiferilactobacillus shenzhenensis]|uniref:DUF1828 domain-containing protein n=1 Tax=Schleiferilactobacillus shenzhenensis LY-73 TaxID=1231336 RepID=U4TG97_9LACO|nr:DUF1828 domain-containing protein [Schleiferilactobacillus shenzhenensis]ERL63791.1 hypothetical protein L248_2151 [Schleiferilactobacillus shenzhenensis LY-73]